MSQEREARREERVAKSSAEPENIVFTRIFKPFEPKIAIFCEKYRKNDPGEKREAPEQKSGDFTDFRPKNGNISLEV